MSKVYSSVCELIGHTPVMEIKNIERQLHLQARILVKLERTNPAGSAKDRVALSMIKDAEESGRLQPGGTIIEPTSGNTGIGLAACAASLGYKTVIVMPDTMSEERRKLMTAYGARLELSDGKLGMAGAVALAEKLQKEIPGSIIAGQFDNDANSAAHYKTTGPEIWEDTEGCIDAFAAGVGTGGTITGTGHFLKEKNADIKIVGIEPAASAFISKGIKGPHDLQGIGAGFIPKVLDVSVIDEIITITDEEAYEMGRLLARSEGILAGITSGAALAAAVKLATRAEYEGKTIVALLPDTGERYLSTKMFSEN